jgi:hypothetical protein
MEIILTLILSIVLSYLMTMATYAMLSESIVIHDYIQYWKMVFKHPGLFIYNIIIIFMSIMTSLFCISKLK